MFWKAWFSKAHKRWNVIFQQHMRRGRPRAELLGIKAEKISSSAKVTAVLERSDMNKRKAS
jgi:hypothetical protein